MKKILLGILGCAACAWGGELVVAPGGLSPQAALDKIVAAKKAGSQEAWTVRVKYGRYFLTQPLVFTPEASGTQKAPVTWIGEPSVVVAPAKKGLPPVLKESVISGGIALTGWRDEGNGVWSAPVPARAGDGAPAYFEQLWVNGRRATRARLPNKGYLRITAAKNVPIGRAGAPRTPPGGSLFLERATLADTNAVAVLAKIPASEMPYAQMCVVHKWTSARRVLRGVDPATKTVETRFDKAWTGWNGWNPKQTLLSFENVRAAFDAPGEWFYDAAAKRVLYRPLPGEDLRTAQVIAPDGRHSQLVTFKGDPAKGAFVHDIAFQNLVFENSAAPGALNGNGPTEKVQHQAASSYDGAITAIGVTRLAWKTCAVRHTGNYAFRFNDGCTHCTITNCTMEDLGAGGVWMGAAKGTVPPGQTLSRRVIRALTPYSTAFNRIENCTIRGGGRFNPEGTGVALTHASDCKVLHCDIYDFYYTGVSVGWTWGFAGSVAQRNEIGFNRIFDLGKAVMSDMGGVYTLGTSYGTTVHDNVIHDVTSFDYGGWALYTDEGSEGIVMERNLCWNTTDGGFHQHYGAGCVIRNNIFAWNRMIGAVRMYRDVVQGVPCTLNFVNNIVLVKEGPLASEGVRRVGGIWANNLWWSIGVKPTFGGLDWKAWCASGKETGSRLADPQFENPRCFPQSKNGKPFDFRLKPTSPAFALGFKAWDYTQAGRK